MKKPLRLDTSRFRMLDKESWNISCAVCDKRQSKWELVISAITPGEVDTKAPICALCFLYESKWGKERAVDINEYLGEVMAQETKRKMILGPTGALTNNDDADFILGILALTSRRFDVEDLQLKER